VPVSPLRRAPSAADLDAGLDRIRAELRVPARFPPAAEAEAAAAAARGPRADGARDVARRDRRDLPLVTIDPPGSRDLDQALGIARRPGGWRVSYAIADVAAFVAPGGALDAVAHERGTTLYLPDGRTPLHPPAIGEGAASLLPGEDRPALLWTIDLGEAGEQEAAVLERATVRSGEALGYPEAQRRIDAGAGGEILEGLRAVGRLRREREVARGGVSLTVPVQEVVREGEGYGLRFEAPLPVEDWNAQISLLAGMAAARIMAEGGVGLFRAMPPAGDRVMQALRASAGALGVAWPAGARYPDVVRALDPRRPGDAAFSARAARAMGGASYVAWTAADGTAPPGHAALAALYAHVTAPLRRLADRAANEVVLALCAGREPPAWARHDLPALPAAMRRAAGRENAAERAAVDLVEAAVLAGRVGEVFPATVIDERDGKPVVQVADPPVVATVADGGPAPGREVRVRLEDADPRERRVVFRAVPPG
jgi:exoribonuclease R